MASYEIVERAAREVLETTAGLTVGEVEYPVDADGAMPDVLAAITLAGTLGGTLLVHCPWVPARRAAATMAGSVTTDEGGGADDATVRDALGELASQIAGTMKRKLEASDREVVLSVPVVVSGVPVSHCVQATGRPVTVLLEVEDGAFTVSFWKA